MPLVGKPGGGANPTWLVPHESEVVNKYRNIEQRILNEEVIVQNKNQAYLWVYCISKINFGNGHFLFAVFHLFVVKIISNIEQGILNEEVMILRNVHYRVTLLRNKFLNEFTPLLFLHQGF